MSILIVAVVAPLDTGLCHGGILSQDGTETERRIQATMVHTRRQETHVPRTETGTVHHK